MYGGGRWHFTAFNDGVMYQQPAETLSGTVVSYEDFRVIVGLIGM